MCGRSYSTVTEAELQARYETEVLKRNPLGELKPNFNTCPTQVMPVVLVREGKREIDYLRWGLVPAWAESVKDASKYSLINARGEEILKKKSYSTPFKKRRCIVPLSGFFEWKRNGDKKIPFAIHLKDKDIMSVAGVWEHWVDKKTGEVVDSFALITTSANEIMSAVHDRMPVILKKEDEAKWLDPNNQNLEELLNLLKPCESEILNTYQVSTMVNSPKNNVAEILNPVGA